MESCSGEEFQLGEVVWAKVIGYPWWPGTVTQVSPHRPQIYRIDFFFDHQHAYLGHQKLSKYSELRDHIDTHRHMPKGLRKAVLEADKVHSSFVEGADSSPSATLQGRIPLPAQKQLLQPHLLQEQASVHQQQHSFGQQQSQPIPEEEAEMTHQLYSRQQREKYVNTLLKKYVLSCLPKAVLEEEEPKRHRKVQKRQWRRANKSRMISKVTYEGHSLMFLLTRKIYSMLGGKQLPISQRREISLSLGKQVLGGAEQASALFKWISISGGQAIANFYQSWGSMQGEKEKNSSMTTVE